MIKLIKSFIASSAHMNAQNHWSQHNRADAYAQICRAVRLETNEKLLPRHLVFKGEIESSIGHIEESRASLEWADTITKKYPEYWSKKSNADLVCRLHKALEQYNLLNE